MTLREAIQGGYTSLEHFPRNTDSGVLSLFVDCGVDLTDPEQDDYHPPYIICWSCEGIGRYKGENCKRCDGRGLIHNPAAIPGVG